MLSSSVPSRSKRKVVRGRMGAHSSRERPTAHPGRRLMTGKEDGRLGVSPGPSSPDRSMIRRNFALTLLIPFALAACGHGAKGDTIVIGVTGPFSQPRGVSMKAGAELARDEINKAGGIDGKQVELIFEDDSANNDAAVRIAGQF